MTDMHYKKIEELNKSLAKDPNNLNLLMQKAAVYFDGYDNNAIDIYKQIIKLYPDYLDAYFWLSYYLYRIACMISEAIDIARKGLKIKLTYVCSALLVFKFQL